MLAYSRATISVLAAISIGEEKKYERKVEISVLYEVPKPLSVNERMLIIINITKSK